MDQTSGEPSAFLPSSVCILLHRVDLQHQSFLAPSLTHEPTLRSNIRIGCAALVPASFTQTPTTRRHIVDQAVQATTRLGPDPQCPSYKYLWAVPCSATRGPWLSFKFVALSSQPDAIGLLSLTVALPIPPSHRFRIRIQALSFNLHLSTSPTTLSATFSETQRPPSGHATQI